MTTLKTALLAATLSLFLLWPSHARAYYDPGTQRWLNRDPIGENGGLNVYGCMRNNPINAIDPLGLKDLCRAGKPLMGTGLSHGSNAEFLGDLGIAGGLFLGLGGGAALLETYGARILVWLGLGGTAAESPQAQAAIRRAVQEGHAILDKIARYEDAVFQAQIRLRIALSQMSRFPDQNSLGHISAEEQWRAAQQELSNALRALERARMCGN